MPPEAIQKLAALEGRIAALRSETRALLSLGLTDEANQVHTVVESLELLHIDHFNLYGPIVEYEQERGAL